MKIYFPHAAPEEESALVLFKDLLSGQMVRHHHHHHPLTQGAWPQPKLRAPPQPTSALPRGITEPLRRRLRTRRGEQSRRRTFGEGAAVIAGFRSVGAGGRRRRRWWRRSRGAAGVMSRITASARQPPSASDVFECHAALFNTVRSISRRRKAAVGGGGGAGVESFVWKLRRAKRVGFVWGGW